MNVLASLPQDVEDIIWRLTNELLMVDVTSELKETVRRSMMNSVSPEGTYGIVCKVSVEHSMESDSFLSCSYTIEYATPWIHMVTFYLNPYYTKEKSNLLQRACYYFWSE